jgi:hypothetical protein
VQPLVEGMQRRVERERVQVGYARLPGDGGQEQPSGADDGDREAAEALGGEQAATREAPALAPVRAPADPGPEHREQGEVGQQYRYEQDRPRVREGTGVPRRDEPGAGERDDPEKDEMAADEIPCGGAVRNDGGALAG